jgi:uncharacterized protein (DUF2461 family)
MYLHVSAAGLLLAGGYHETSSAQVDRLRRAVADDIAGVRLERVLAGARKRGLVIEATRITRVPPGFPKDHPRAELLRFKTLIAEKDIGCPPWLATPKATAEITKVFRAIEPVVAWLNTHVGRD